MSEENGSSEGAITIKKHTLWQVGTFVFAALFIISLFTGGFGIGGGSTGGSITGNAVAPTNPTNPAPSDVKVQIEADDPVLGDKNAPVTIVEFSDFQCPFCERAHTGAMADFKNSDYFKKGQVNLVYKEFPLTSIHPYSQKAAEAAECANRQGKFWEYHNQLFTDQATLTSTLQSGGISAVVTSLKGYATQLKLDTGKFNKCLDGGEATAEVSKESQQAQAAGGQGTPYFVVVNNKNQKTQAVSGAVPYAQFDSAIQAVQ